MSGFAGCCGSVKNDKCLLGFVSNQILSYIYCISYSFLHIYLIKYSFCMIVIVAAQSTLLVILFITKQEIMTNFTRVYTNRLKSFNITYPNRFEFAFHKIQLRVN